MEKNMDRFKWDSLSLNFHKYQDKSSDSPGEGQVEVEVNLLHVNHKKRKDSASLVTTLNIGKVLVRNNPSDEEKVDNLLDINSSHFNVGDSCCNKSTILQLKVLHPVSEIDISPPKKKFRKSKEDQVSSKKPLHSCNVQRNTEKKRSLQAELLIINRKSNCCLTEGVYELELQEDQYNSRFSENAVWQAVSDDKCDISHIGSPKIIFTLQWTQKPNEINCSFKNDLQNKCFNTGNPSSFQGRPLVNETSITSAFAPVNIKKQKIFYQFLSANNSRQQTLAKESKCCPWCLVDCKVLSSLLCHLKYCHGRFNFTYVDIQSGGRIDVSMNDLYDGSYVGNPHDMHRTIGQAFSRSGPMRRMNVTELLVSKNKLSSLRKSIEIESDNKPRPVVHGHTRLYYHTMTCQSIDPKNMEVDSESENDPVWLRLKTQQMIDEFMDVNEGEKEIMKLWNLHVMHHNYVGDCQMPEACKEFIRLHGQIILKRNLKKNLVLHLSNLFDFGLLTSRELCSAITQLLKLQPSSD